jgi:acyl-CoA dehydrogenase
MTAFAPLPTRTNIPYAATPSLPATPAIDWVARVRGLGPSFAARAVQHDQGDAFVADNYVELRNARVFSAGIPAKLGGGDATYGEQCEMVTELAHHCGSTALALSMHLHLVAAMVWKWRHQKAPLDALLQRIAEKQLVLVSSGGSDWLQSSGTAEAVPGGYRIQAHKAFASGCPAGDWLMTSAVYQDPKAGPTVLHFPIPLRSPNVKTLSTWRTLGMRGTGSQDVLIDSAFVPEEGVTVRRPCGCWHPAMHLASKVALPLIYSTYVGIAEAARELALHEARAKQNQAEAQQLAGEMENQLFTCRLAHERMVEFASYGQPGPETTNGVLMARTLVAESAIGTVEKAIELVGGRSFYRNLGLERLYRDVQAARFHPMPAKPQQLCAGRHAFGLDLDGV